MLRVGSMRDGGRPSGRDPGTALAAPVLEDRAAGPGLHPSAEAVLALPAPRIGLKGSLRHGGVLIRNRLGDPELACRFPHREIRRGFWGSGEYSGKCVFPSK